MNLSKQTLNKQEQKRDFQLQYDSLRNKSWDLNEDINTAKLNSERGELKEKQKIIHQKMDEVAKVLEQLDQEILGAAGVKELYSIVVYVSLEIINSAYQSSLSGVVSNDQELDVKEKLLRLAEIPRNPLPEFVSRIINDYRLVNQDGKIALLQWLKVRGLELIQFSPVEKHLLVKVKPAENDTLYLVETIFTEIQNPLSAEYEEKSDARYFKVDSNPLQEYSEFELREELPGILCNAIKACHDVHGVAKSDLMIECFLPIPLLDLPVNQWPVRQDGTGSKCGQLCKSVVIRIYDQNCAMLCDDALSDKQKYWQRLWSSPDIYCSQALEDFALIDGPKYLNRLNQQVVGCQFIAGGNQQQDFWEAFLEQGIPVALWLRQSSMDSSVTEGFINSLVAEDPISKLPEALTCHRGSGISGVEHLSLLWDNPFRTFPDESMYSKNTKVV